MRMDITSHGRGLQILRAVAALFIMTAGMAGAADAPKPSPFTQVSFKLKTDSKVSVAIYNEQGGIVRQLLMAAPRKAGRNEEAWNGLDDKGKPVPPGKYAWKLLSSQGLKAEWITSLGSGLNPGWQTMPGNHVGAVNANVDDAGDVYVMGGNGECVPAMGKVTRSDFIRFCIEKVLDGKVVDGKTDDGG